MSSQKHNFDNFISFIRFLRFTLVVGLFLMIILTQNSVTEAQSPTDDFQPILADEQYE